MKPWAITVTVPDGASSPRCTATRRTFEGGTARRRLHELGVEARPGVTPTAFADGALVVVDGHRLAREIESDDAGMPAEPRPERDADAATVSFVSRG
ncbi:MAG TPA: hypothetical protein VGO78_10535 [Acidimicrobiales bacterium]|nr:hypothetical protein [Acidimicrobiales bacterium]